MTHDQLIFIMRLIDLSIDELNALAKAVEEKDFYSARHLISFLRINLDYLSESISLGSL